MTTTPTTNTNTTKSPSQADIEEDDKSSSSTSALQQAQQLQVPKAASTTLGESEHLEFWDTHDTLLQQAWEEWSSSIMIKNAQNNESSSLSLLPSLRDDSQIVNETIYRRIQNLWKESPSLENEQALMFRRLRGDDNDDNAEDESPILQEPIPGVWVMKNFLTPDGIRRIRRHLEAIEESSKIPTRRPNGMNRYGVVLDDETAGGVWYPEIAEFRTWLVDTYVRPLGRMLFPEYYGNIDDDSSAYAFTIRYSAEHDVQLKEHSDASIVTMNINLNDPDDENENNNYEGSSLLFRNKSHGHNDDDGSTSDYNYKLGNNNSDDNQKNEEDDDEWHELKMEPGMAVIHRGLHRHQALPIEKGERLQLIVWLFGPYGYVRFAPYEPHERMTPEQRWSKLSSSSDSSLSSNNAKSKDESSGRTASKVLQDACWNLQVDSGA